MKKIIVALLALVALTFCLAGCQFSPTPVKDNTTTAADKASQIAALNEYIASIKEQSDAIKTSLEKDALTQTDMNLKSQELCDLWDGALNHLLDEAKKTLNAAELEKFNAEQSAWAADRDAAAEAAGKEFEGGSLYALVVNSEAARLTEERVSALLELLK